MVGDRVSAQVAIGHRQENLVGTWRKHRCRGRRQPRRKRRKVALGRRVHEMHSTLGVQHHHALAPRFRHDCRDRARKLEVTCLNQGCAARAASQHPLGHMSVLVCGHQRIAPQQRRHDGQCVAVASQAPGIGLGRRVEDPDVVDGHRALGIRRIEPTPSGAEVKSVNPAPGPYVDPARKGRFLANLVEFPNPNATGVVQCCHAQDRLLKIEIEFTSMVDARGRAGAFSRGARGGHPSHERDEAEGAGCGALPWNKRLEGAPATRGVCSASIAPSGSDSPPNKRSTRSSR